MGRRVKDYLITLANNRPIHLEMSPKRNIYDIQAEANIWAIPCNGGKPECGRGEDENPLICSLPEELTALSIILVYLGLFLSMLGVLLYKFGKLDINDLDRLPFEMDTAYE